MFQLFGLALLITLRTVYTMPLSDDYESTSTTSTFSPTTELQTADTPSTTDIPKLQELDDALTKIANVYMQALFSGTHTTELEQELSALEMRLFELLDALYKEERMAEYMKYEADVTQQLIIYSLLKKLFGYAKDEN